jgi:hypothetical protein
MARRPALLAVSAAVAALALTGCSDADSTTPGGTGTPTSATSPTTATSSPDVGASASSLASGASSAASSAGDQLAAIRDCLQKANLPTPTSTDATGLITELPQLIARAEVRQALEQCNIPLPG